MTVLSKPANSEINNFFVAGEHRGLDYGWGQGKQIYAAADGVVESVYDGGPNAWGQGWGNRVVIRHNARTATTYNHIASGTIGVSVGDSVSVGQQIATMGETGLTFGIHLHFELYVDGERVDPLPYFSQDLPGSDGSGSGGVPAPGGWVVGTTDFTGRVGLIEQDGGKWYSAPPQTDPTVSISAECSRQGISEAQSLEWTNKLRNSKWGGLVMVPGSSWWDGSDRYYAGHTAAMNDVAGIWDANEAAALAAQEAAVQASVVPVPEATDVSESNKGVFDRRVAAKQLAELVKFDTEEIEEDVDSTPNEIVVQPRPVASIDTTVSHIKPAEVPANILGSLIRNASARFWVYSLFFLGVLALRSMSIGYVAAQLAVQAQLPDFAQFLVIATAVVTDLSPFVAVLAAANTTAGKTVAAGIIPQKKAKK